MKYKKKYVFLFISNLILAVSIALLAPAVIKLNKKYIKTVSINSFYQLNQGVYLKYCLGNNDNLPAELYVGDLLGVNFVSSKMIESNNCANDDITRISLIRIKEQAKTISGEEDFLSAISNVKGIVLADNFCIKNWDKLKEDEIYKNTSLSPGQFCFSEPQTLMVDNLIKRFNIKKVFVYYDNQYYLKFINTFLVYLSEKNIQYELVRSIKNEDK